MATDTGDEHAAFSGDGNLPRKDAAAEFRRQMFEDVDQGVTAPRRWTYGSPGNVPSKRPDDR